MTWFEQLRARFPALGKWIYLNTAMVGPISVDVHQAGREVLDGLLMGGGVDVGIHLARSEEARQALSLLLHCQPHEIAFTENTSHSTALAARMLWDAGYRRAVALEHEFPASTIPFLHLGYDLRFVESDRGRYPLERIERALRGRDVLICSQVMYSTGQVNDPVALGQVARQNSAHLLLCAYQALGALRVDAWQAGASFVTGAGAKWLGAGYGAGYLVMREDLIGHLRWPSVGWMSARDYPLLHNHVCNFHEREARVIEGGTPSMVSRSMFGEACRFWLAAGPRRVEARVRELTGHLRRELADRGLIEQTDDNDDPFSGITIVPTEQPTSLVTELRNRRIITTFVRGGVRISLHAFNNGDDIARLVESLQYIRDRLGIPIGMKR
jgi:cysteine desulfurase / selenocysteine lyase